MTADITDIWTDFHKELKSYIAKVVKNQTDADDILQEVFIKIIRNNEKVNRLKTFGSTFMAWFGMPLETISEIKNFSTVI
jgi:DNA-directed RNA polymerase specialized sigma24 family protein